MIEKPCKDLFSFLPFLFIPLIERPQKAAEDRIKPQKHPSLLKSQTFNGLSAAGYKLGKKPYLGPRNKS